MNHIFLLNPAAGDGNNIRRLLPMIRSASARTGIPYTLYESKTADDTVRLIQRCADTGKRYRFYSCGGDGTLRAAARGAMNQPNIEIGCVPCGTGNDFVRNFGGKQRFLDLEAQLRGQAVPIDLIVSSDGQIAVNIVNIGFDCNIADGASDFKHLPLISGTPAYLLSLTNELTRPLGQKMAISADGGTVQLGQFLLCAIGNGGYCGGGFRALPNADLRDGLLNLSTVRTMSRREILPLLPRYYTGTYLTHPYAKKYVCTQTCRTVSIRTPAPVRISYDGDIVRTSSVTLTIQPGAVQLCLPQVKQG